MSWTSCGGSTEVGSYLRETWDLHAGALVAFLMLAVILRYFCVIPSWAVPLTAVGGAVLSVFGGLWLLSVAGGREPW